MSHSTSKLVPVRLKAKEAWIRSGELACKTAEAFAEAGYHKQIVNRLIEPFAHTKMVCTATEYDNFFWLRRHEDAQPEIKELADRMWEAREASRPQPLEPGQWHVPYFEDGWVVCDGPEIQRALMISASCCAQVSYRKLDESLEKAERIFQLLIAAEPPHFSPFEHQATPMQPGCEGSEVPPPGTTHISFDKGQWTAWSGNFRTWTQYRQLIMSDRGIRPF